MKNDAREYLESQGYTEEDQGEGYILNVSEMIALLNGFSEHKNKELHDKYIDKSAALDWQLEQNEVLKDKNKELIEALNRISAYQSIETLQKDSEKDWGLEYEEALEMSYENMQNEANALLKTNKK